MVEDLVDQPHHIGLGDMDKQRIAKQTMVDRREMLTDVAAQHIAMALRQMPQADDGAMRAATGPIGIGIGDENALEARLDDLAQRVVYDPIAECRRADAPAFGFMDVEMPIGQRPIAPASSSSEMSNRRSAS
jgi:hypothetical protein